MLNDSGSGIRKVSESESEPDADPQFEPLVTLPEVEVSTNEENEEELVKLRAKLFRFDTSDPEIPEWKERGTGEVKLLRHTQTHSVRVVMRRDKTLKICANHFVTPWMELKPSAGSNRAWVWTVPADFADEKPRAECLAIRFATPEIASQWKEKFEEAQTILKTKCHLYKDDYKQATENQSSEEESDVNDDDDDDESVIKPEIEAKTENLKDEKVEKIVIEKLKDLNVSK